MRYLILAIVFAWGLFPLYAQTEERLLYQSDAFKIYGDRLEQQAYKTVAESSSKLISNYKLPPDSTPGPINMRVREIQTDLKTFPLFSSGFKLIDALHQLSLEEMVMDIRPDHVFMLGEKSEAVNTRDISYSALLSLVLLDPETVKTSLMLRVKNKKIVQDSGTGGGWPVSTDREAWVLAAWEVYKATGNKEWLKQAFEIAANTMADDQKYAFNSEYGLFYGESSFLDAREQTYPKWMEPVDIHLSLCLSTNAVFYQSLNILSQMAALLQVKSTYALSAEKLKSAINHYFWLEDRGYYSQYLYGHYCYSPSPRIDALGSSLCILFDIADRQQMNKLMANVPVYEYGIPCISPQIPQVEAYQNGAIWPMIQSYWTWAAARSHVSSVVELSMAGVYRQAALFLTNKQNLLSSTGDFNGLKVNSDRFLGSVAGSLSMVYRILFGLDLQADQLNFSPFVPRSYESKLKLSGFKYRGAILDIEVEGFGDGVSALEMDGVRLERKAILASVTGHHKVVLKMNRKIEYGTFNLEKNTISLDAPDLHPIDNKLGWTACKDARYYLVYLNGTINKQYTSNSFFYQQDNRRGEYQVLSIDRKMNESFLSKPYFYYPEKEIVNIDAAMFGKPIDTKDSNLKNKPVSISLKDTKPFVFEVKVPKKGKYVIEFSYANGNGAVETGDLCQIAELSRSGKMIGTVVFPQGSAGNWSSFGRSKPLKVSLSGGRNKIELKLVDPSQAKDNSNHILVDKISVFPAF